MINNKMPSVTQCVESLTMTFMPMTDDSEGPYPRQIGGTDPAARGGWWLAYAEHATVLGLAGVLAASRGSGWRVLRGLCSAVWLYLGMVAALVLPHHPGSWGRIGGAAAVLVGVGFGVAAWRGSEREVTGSPRRALP